MRGLACLLFLGTLGAAAAGGAVAGAPAARAVAEASAAREAVGASAVRASVGAPAPVLALTTLDGIALPAHRPSGTVTVLNFWATWCPPCRAETPDLNAAYRRLHANGVNFLGIDTTETGPIVKTFLSAKGVPYPSVLGGPKTYNAYGVAFIPTTVVVDAAGIVRARWVGGVTPQQLAHYVADARTGRSSTYISADQARIDALLAPRRFDFTGVTAKREAAVAAVPRAIASAEKIAADNEATVDYERTLHAEGALLVAAGTAVRQHAVSGAQKAAGLVTFARGSGDLNRWEDAASAYRAALALVPGDTKLVKALASAYYRLHDYDAMIAQARRYTQLRSDDGDAWSELGLAYQRTHRFRLAVPVYEKSLALLRAEAAKKPSQDALADVADTSLDAADVYVSLGDTAGARRTFAQGNAYADRLAANGPYARLKRNVRERTQEGLVAAALAGGVGKPVVSVMPWTGPDLPGSLASTLKYRLIVAARPAATVTLNAQGLKPKWVASFCADGLCSPRTVSFQSPASGVKTFEFQLVPPYDGDHPGTIAISAGGGITATLPPAGTASPRP